MPAGAVYVGRPTKWGNPFVADAGREYVAVTAYHARLIGEGQVTLALLDNELCRLHPRFRTASGVVYIPRLLIDVHAVRSELAGRDLCCWCPLDRCCHADVLLEIANQ